MIKFVDMFSGIGGFREGLTRAGGFACVGHCEIDKYANRSYNALFDTKGEWFIEDARKADPSTMPDFQLLCGGFPCQTFSIAGSRKGFGDPRGTLFFELARLAEARKPPYLLFENVPGLLSHDGGRTFATILNTLDRLGYGVEWQCLNSKDFGVPQSRNRVYIIGYLDERCRGKVFPFTETTGGSLIQTHGGHQGERVYSPEGLSCTLAANPGGFGGKTGLYEVGVPIKCATKTGYQMAQFGDSIQCSTMAQSSGGCSTPRCTQAKSKPTSFWLWQSRRRASTRSTRSSEKRPSGIIRRSLSAPFCCGWDSSVRSTKMCGCTC